jgi:hypothetical protein
MEMTIDLWKSMTGREQTLWLEANRPVSSIGAPRKPIFGFGLNDVAYCSRLAIDGVMVACPAYSAWKEMLTRAYSEKYLTKRPTYSGVKVCDEWHSFSTFRIWWLQNQVDGWHLDKDILSDSRVYSPEASLFVPAWINTFTINRRSARGMHPIGAHYHSASGRFRAQCSNPATRKRERLGLFDTPEAAHLAWKARKLELALELKPEMDSIDMRIYPRVVEIINNSK